MTRQVDGETFHNCYTCGLPLYTKACTIDHAMRWHKVEMEWVQSNSQKSETKQ